MTILHGEGVSRGVACGTLRFLEREAPAVEKCACADPEAEVRRFDGAVRTAIAQLGALCRDTAAKLGEEAAVLFQIHQVMLEDEEYRDAVHGIIRAEGVTAEYAVHKTAEQFSALFAAMENEYMRARSADVLDISRRMIRALTGRASDSILPDGPSILAADDLVPSETARLDPSAILAFITSGGSRSSHTAIFARTLGIPAVACLGGDLRALSDGAEVWVDGTTGEVFVQADEETAAKLRRRREAEEARKARLERCRNHPAVAGNGKRILLCANIVSPQDLPAALRCGADGVGLFRSEFLYLGRTSYPTEDEQYAAYRQVAEAMGKRRVVIRTLDIGADKRVGYFNLPKEENPAMGLRAIRLCLTRPQIFKTQLRALYRASVHGNLAIMFPLITSLWELREAKAVCAQVRAELAAEGIPFRSDLPLGIMVETPAAAVISDLLAREADFFSIGTNDLTQYTLATDRQNAAMEPFCDRHHEAVLRLIRMTAENAHAAGIWVGICGELAADPSLTEFFLDAGIDELSMVPASLLEVRANILAPI
ncbi:MAG: phosphoenolpyruvate--protein phosphotransferase [Clostridia bacterium]|nr:phosphoenolpyruvate--protein phosphotransferase [Clostridia bacterium]